MYVVCTRAVEQLHIISDIKENKDGVKDDHTSGVLINFLKDSNRWQEGNYVYEFGNKMRNSEYKKPSTSVSEQNQFISNHWKNHNLVLLASDSKLWDTEQGKAIDYGNLLHQIMQEIVYENDMNSVLIRYKNSGILTDEQYKILQSQIMAIVHHKDLKSYFSDGIYVFNEREIVTEDNQVIIPDRLNFISSNDVVVMDYKTGAESKKHHLQLLNYKNILENMNLTVQKLLLVYINEKINVVEVSTKK